jgi:hypothetical protein
MLSLDMHGDIHALFHKLKLHSRSASVAADDDCDFYEPVYT